MRIGFELSKHINIHHILVPVVCVNFIIVIIVTVLNRTMNKQLLPPISHIIPYLHVRRDYFRVINILRRRERLAFPFPPPRKSSWNRFSFISSLQFMIFSRFNFSWMWFASKYSLIHIICTVNILLYNLVVIGFTSNCSDKNLLLGFCITKINIYLGVDFKSHMVAVDNVYWPCSSFHW